MKSKPHTRSQPPKPTRAKGRALKRRIGQEIRNSPLAKQAPVAIRCGCGSYYGSQVENAKYPGTCPECVRVREEQLGHS